MSMAALRSNLAQFARQAAAASSPARIGLVSSYDPTTHHVKVRIQPEDVETGFMPISTLQIGAGWGVYAAPSVGDQAIVQFPEGDVFTGVCLGFLPSDADQPPSVPSGEVHVIHKGGAFFKLTNDGKIKTHGAWEHDGTLHTTQDITCDTTVTATTDVVGGGKHLKTHIHSGVQSGGSNTGQPV